MPFQFFFFNLTETEHKSGKGIFFTMLRINTRGRYVIASLLKRPLKQHPPSLFTRIQSGNTRSDTYNHVKNVTCSDFMGPSIGNSLSQIK